MINFLHTAFVNFIHIQWQQLHDFNYILALICAGIAGCFLAEILILKKTVKCLKERCEIIATHYENVIDSIIESREEERSQATAINNYHKGIIAGLEKRLKAVGISPEPYLIPTDDTSK